MAITVIRGVKEDESDFVDNIFILDKTVFIIKKIFRKLFIRLNIDKGIKVILY